MELNYRTGVLGIEITRLVFCHSRGKIISYSQLLYGSQTFYCLTGCPALNLDLMTSVFHSKGSAIVLKSFICFYCFPNAGRSRRIKVHQLTLSFIHLSFHRPSFCVSFHLSSNISCAPLRDSSTYSANVY